MIQQGLFHIIDGQVAPRKCTACELSYCSKLVTNCMPGEGSTDCVMFVGKHPAIADDEMRRPMTGQNGALFYELLRDAGFTQHEIYVTNCVKCAPREANATKRIWDACSVHFLEELRRVCPRMIVAVGADALTWLTGETGVSSLRGTGLTCQLDQNYVVYPIRQPMALNHVKDPSDRAVLKAEMVQDLETLRRIYYAGGRAVVDVVSSNVDYKTAETEEDVLRMLAEVDAHTGPVSCDLETWGFDPEAAGAEIAAIGFSMRPGQGFAIPLAARGSDRIWWWADDVLPRIVRRVVHTLQNRHRDVFGHNFIKFDCKWLRSKWQLDLVDVQYDTLLASYAALHNLRSYELEVLASSLCGMRRWKEPIEKLLQDTPHLCRYLCTDVDAQYRVKLNVDDRLDPNELCLLQNILIPLAKELSYMEQRGVMIDMEKLNELESILKNKIAEAEAEIHAVPEVVAYEIDTATRFNSNSPMQLRDILFNRMKLQPVEYTETKLPSTGAPTMEHYESTVPLCGKIMRARRLSKLDSTNVSGLREVIRDSIVHTTYKEHGTVTGRLSSSEPNLQNIPRAGTAKAVLEDGKMMKAIFRARPSRCLIQADYSQAELRCMASIANDENMIEMFRQGVDIHRATAAAVIGCTLDEVTDDQRTSAKKVNFGIIYGKTLKGLIEDFGDEQKATAFYTGHQRQFPAVWRYMDEQKELVVTQGFQTTWFGRTRVYETKSNEEFRQAYNFPIQSYASDCTEISLIRCGQSMRAANMKSYPLLTVHDSIIFEVDLDEFWTVAQMVKHIMESISFPWMRVPMTVDLQAGKNWGSLQDLDMRNFCFKQKK